MIVYFTGTGNSRYCARMLADKLGDHCTDAFHFIRDSIAAELSSAKPWVFVCPTYSWQLPRVFADFIRAGRFSGSRDAYFVMTCGGDIGNAADKNRALCQVKGFRYRGTLPVVMPENYIAMLSAPDRKEALGIIAAARPVLEQAAEYIQRSKDFPARKAGTMDHLKSGLVNTLFYRFNVKASPFYVAGSCVLLRQVRGSLPLGNIRMEQGAPVWGSRCTHCMACICGCPTGAIEYGKASKGKPRYQCPDYQG